VRVNLFLAGGRTPGFGGPPPAVLETLDKGNREVDPGREVEGVDSGRQHPKGFCGAGTVRRQ